MPRDASNVYHVPPGSDGTPNTVISSARYNTLIHDLESDANNPRPIVAGGTGSSTPQTAIAALGAAPNNQIVIPNYASMTFITGFFNSDATVSDAPVTGHRFVGNASFINSTNGTLQCRDLDDISQPGRVYCREMNGGVWGPWTLREGVYISDTPPTNPWHGCLWWESDAGGLYIYFDDGNTKQWVTVQNTPAYPAVRYDAPQGLTATQQAQGRTNLAIHMAEPATAAVDLNTMTTAGTFYTIDTSTTNGPAGISDTFFLMIETNGPGNVKQTLTALSTGITWIRTQQGGTWKPWQIAGGSVTISDIKPTTVTNAGSLWWQSSTGILYILYNDGTSTQWVAIVPGLGGNFVQFDPQTLTTAQQSQARANIGAMVAMGTPKTRMITATGTYVPTPGTLFALVEGCGGGGAGGGVNSTGTTNSLAAGGGAGGTYSRVWLTAAQIGAGLAATIGAGGTAVAGGNGGAGGQTSLAAFLTAPGGGGGFLASTSASPACGQAGALGTGDASIQGADGGAGLWFNSATITSFGGFGGSSQFAGMRVPPNGSASSNTAGVAGRNYGGGGTGASSMGVTGTPAGGAGAPGAIMVTEYGTWSP
jgi:hypothetical protein